MVHHISMALLVGLGGSIGAMCRYCVTLIVQQIGTAWPFGTMVANILGCFVIGIVSAFAERGGIPSQIRLTLATGFCGGFTTMSSMVYETSGMLRTSAYHDAVLYTGVTLVFSFAAYVSATVLVRSTFQ